MNRPNQPEVQMYEESMGAAPGRARMQGRRVLVVGAGQRPGPDAQAVGNGRAISLLLAREGAAVACADRSAESAQATCDLIAAQGGRAIPIVADVEKPEDITRMLAEAAAGLDGLDGMVVNVGITQGIPMGQLTAENWDYEYRVNLRGPMLCCQGALQTMAPGSSAVLLSSVAAIRSSSRAPTYETAKAAINVLARTVAMAGEPRGIRCNAVAPGAIDTPLGRSEAARNPHRVRAYPFGRQGTPWEVAYATLFLLSREASYINGTVLLVDGGLVSGIIRSAPAP
ncbi:MAG: SDR family oxidoreductase [Burkholderiaceae bacterium]|nr:SDR family oxidoreductase [Burkholderiaceae bacterium]